MTTRPTDFKYTMKFENHGGPCKSGCERIACMCAHEKLAREYHSALARVRELEAELERVKDDAREAAIRSELE